MATTAQGTTGAKSGLTRGLGAVEAAFDKLLAATGAVATGLMILISFLVLALSFSRTILRINVPGLFDGPVYALMAFPFLTMAYAMKKGRHIIIDTFTSKLSEKAVTLLNVALYTISLVYVAVLAWQGGRWIPVLYNRGVMTEALFAIPKWIPVSIIVFGSLLLILQIIRVVMANIRLLHQKATRSGESVWLPTALLILGVGAGVGLFVYVNQIAGISLLALVLLFFGMPVFLAFGMLGVIGIYFLLGSASLMQVPITAYGSMKSFSLACLPLFILGGIIMEQSGIADDLFHFLELCVGRWAASPLLVTIAMGMLFDAISGSTTATHAVVGAIALPMLMKRGFNKALSCGVVGGAALGTLIPPSTGYVVYGVLTDESVGALFMGTLIPSISLFVLYFLFVIVLSLISKKSLFEKGQIPSQVAYTQATWKQRLSGLKSASWALLTPVIVLGGIATGMFTPTEVAAVLVAYAVLVAVVVKGVTGRKLLDSTLRSAEISAMLLCIIFSAFIFAMVISQLRIAANLVAYAQATNMSPSAVVFIIFMVLLVFGFFMEAVSIKVITLPVFYPLAMAVGIDGIWLGVFYQFMMEVAGLTPPMGLSLFVIKGVTGLPMNVIVRGNIPFVLMMITMVALMYFFPQSVTWLPSIIK